MIAPPDTDDETMLEAVAHSVAALDAASDLDADRTPEDKAFFAQEKASLQPSYDTVFTARQALLQHRHLTTTRHRVRVRLGDVVLDRGVRAGKARMKLELKQLGLPDGADEVFPADIEDIVDAERRVEPGLVQQVVQRFPKVPDFPGKAGIAADLTGRAAAQTANFAEHDASEVTESGLEGTLEKAIADASTALYRLEKRLLERFPREKRYVRAFFLDVAPPRRKKLADQPAPVAPPPAGGAKTPEDGGEKPTGP